MAGTQISDMTLSVALPAGSYAPFVVTDPLTGLNPSINYIFDLGAYRAATDAEIALRPTSAVLAASSGSSLIGFIQSGTDAVARTLQDKVRELEISITDYGAIRDDTSGAAKTANLAAWDAAVAYWVTVPCAVLVVPHGNFSVGNVTLAAYKELRARIRFEGQIISDADGKPALQIGSTSNETWMFNADIQGITVNRSAYDTTSGSIGALLVNVAYSRITIQEVAKFDDGLVCKGQSSGNDTGFYGNNVTLVYVKDNTRNVVLTASGAGGFCNSNNFWGGSMSHFSSFPAPNDAINILIDHSASHNLNYNRFWGPELEDADADSVAAIINGNNNYIFPARLENSADQANYEVQFTANSQFNFFECKSAVSTNIVDNGASNSYVTSEGWAFSADADVSGGEAVVKLRNRVASSAKLIQGYGSDGTTIGWNIDGNGYGNFNDRIYAQNGIRWVTSSGANDDRGLFAASAAPNGSQTANPGSLYARTGGGIATSLYQKSTGGGNTGWHGVQAYSAAATGSRPTLTADEAGFSMYDTTLGKPVWWDGTVWKDATGATV